jgi:hypothetical protein
MRRGSLTGLWHELVQLRPKHHTLLLIWIGPRPNEERRRLAPVDRHMRDSGRHVEVVTRVRDLSLLKLFARPKLHLVAAHQVEGGLVVLVNVGSRPATRR